MQLNVLISTETRKKCVCGGVVMQKVWVLYFLVLPGWDYLSGGLQMYSLGSSSQSIVVCAINALESENRQPGGSVALMGLTDLCRVG